MKKQSNLVTGKILESLIKLSLPILGTSFIQMAYNMTDMIWIGRVGSNAVAAVGTAGFFPWLGMALVFISKIGVEVGVSQSSGRGDKGERDRYIVNAIFINIILAILFTIVIIAFRGGLIDFFDLGNPEVVSMANNYLVIVMLGTIFSFMNPIFTSIFTATGNSKTPFFINTIGLIFNMVFDPLLIFGFGPIPALGVAGAAIATVLAQAVVTGIFICYYIKSDFLYGKKALSLIDREHIKVISKMGLPAALENGLFTVFSMLIGRIIAAWGPTQIAVQKVGSQIEAISWMTAGGFATALTTFVGQNCGAKKPERIKKGFKATLGVSVCVGIIASILLIFFGRGVFSIFIPEEEAILGGIDYLKILGFSQIFMCIEITTAGAFRGLGETLMPSLISIIFTGLRIPLALFLAYNLNMGVNGVWWSITITSAIKGILLIISYKYKSIYYLDKCKIDIDIK